MSYAVGLFPFFIGLAVYFIITTCMGLCALVWALWKLRRLVKGGARLSPFVVCLLLSDLLEVIVLPVHIALMFGNVWSYEIIYVYPIFLVAFIVARNCGLYFHQLVALKEILTVQHQCHPCSCCVLSYPLVTSFAVFLFVILCALTPVFVLHLRRISPLTYFHFNPIIIINVIVAVLTVILQVFNIIKALQLRLCNIVVLFFPYVPQIMCNILLFLMTVISSIDSVWFLIYGVAFCAVSLRLVTEPFLCVRVTRAELRTQSPEEQDYSLNVLSVTEAGPAETSITV